MFKCKLIHITESSESTQTNNLPVNKTPNSDTRYNNNFNVNSYVQSDSSIIVSDSGSLQQTHSPMLNVVLLGVMVGYI